MKDPIASSEIAAARNRNENALAAIIVRLMPAIRLYARRAMVPGLDFDDAVQEGLIGLFYAIEQYDDSRGASFSTYATACIRNAISTAKRSAGRKKHAPLNQSVPLLEGQSIPGPEDQAIASEQVAQTLEKIRTQLSTLEKTVLWLLLGGYTHAQIAKKLGKNLKAVENALARLRRKLRNH